MQKKNKILIIIIILLIVIAISLSVIFILNKRENNNQNINNTVKEKFTFYKEKVSTLLQNDNIIKQLFYSKIDVGSENITVDNEEYSPVSDKYNIKTIEEIYDMIDNTYSFALKGDLVENFNNYNRFINLNDKLYVKFRNKCFINDYNEKELSIKDVKDEVITYVYDNKEYEAYYKDDLYLLGSSPFTC